MSAEPDADVPVVILAGGRGARLVPYTTVLPKPLMPVGDMPILEIVIRQLRARNITEIVLAVGHLASLLEAYFGDGSRWGVNIRYSLEEEPAGTAGPLALVPDLSGTFLVMNGDLLTTLDYSDLVRHHRARGAAATVGIFRRPVAIDLGVVESDGDDNVIEYIEKPTFSYDASVGVYAMEPAVLRHVRPGDRLDLPDLVKALIAAGERVVGYRFEGHWLDIGRPDDYEEAVTLFETHRALFLPDESE